MAKGKFVEWLEPDGLIKLQGWARDGLTEEQISENMGINRRTLSEWKKRFPPILHALKEGKEVVDRHVENALLKRALGYDTTEDKYIYVEMSREEYDERVAYEIEKFDEENPNASRAERDLFILSIPKYKEMLAERKVKHVAPDVTAQIFWLKNRKRFEWRDRQEVQHSGGLNNTNIDMSGLSVEELKAIAKING